MRSATAVIVMLLATALLVGPGWDEPARSIQLVGSAALAPGAARSTPAASGDELWIAIFDGPTHQTDVGNAVAFSPDGSRLFVTGDSTVGEGADRGIETLAYDPGTGAQLWANLYKGPSHGFDEGVAIAVEPDGSRVFVTGLVESTNGTDDIATLAYDARTGVRLWVRQFDGPANSSDRGYAVAVDPTGRRVFVTGSSATPNHDVDVPTFAYDAATGAVLWAGRYDGPGHGTDIGHAMAVSPDGSKVFVTGQSEGARSGLDYITLAYRATSGTLLWARRFRLRGAIADVANSIAVSPIGDRVFVTGDRATKWTTLAYDAATGRLLWGKAHVSPTASATAYAVAASPDATRVFVTGYDTGADTGRDYVTIAYSATSGAELWESRYDGPQHSQDEADVVASSPDGQRVFVTGYSNGANGYYDYATVAYDSATGAQLWTQRYDGSGAYWDVAQSLAVRPDGAEVVVTGYSDTVDHLYDFATIAYVA